jgi:hypothetical protein
MAATEVIHFPLSAQLGLSPLFCALFSSGPASSFPPNLLSQSSGPRSMTQRSVVGWIEHEVEEDLLHLLVRFTDKTELCCRFASRMIIEECVVSDWKSGDFEQLQVFVINAGGRSI